MAESLMHAQNLARSIDVFTLWDRYAMCGQEGAIVIIRDKADILALLLLAQRYESMFEGNLSHLGFGESPSGDEGTTEVFLSKHPKKISLVFGRVSCIL